VSKPHIYRRAGLWRADVREVAGARPGYWALDSHLMLKLRWWLMQMNKPLAERLWPCNAQRRDVRTSDE